MEARPELYLAYHQRLVDILNAHFATIRVLCVDEMACRVPALLYKTLLQEQRLAERIKEQIACELGPYVSCSVGIAPNVFLAKVASDCQKPDGLTIWTREHLPDALFALKLTDLPGIGSAMKRRLHEYGIVSVEQLVGSRTCRLAPGMAQRVRRTLVLHAARQSGSRLSPDVEQ